MGSLEVQLPLKSVRGRDRERAGQVQAEAIAICHLAAEVPTVVRSGSPNGKCRPHRLARTHLVGWLVGSPLQMLHCLLTCTLASSEHFAAALTCNRVKKIEKGIRIISAVVQTMLPKGERTGLVSWNV